MSKYEGDEKIIDELQISKVALQIITKQIKKGIKGKDIEKIKKKILNWFQITEKNWMN